MLQKNVEMLTFCIFDTVMGDPSAKVDWLSAWNTLSGAQGAEVRGTLFTAIQYCY